MNHTDGTAHTDTSPDAQNTGTAPKGGNVRRRMTAVGLTMGLLGGGAAGLIMGTPLFVSAEDSTSLTSTTVSPDDGAAAESGSDEGRVNADEGRFEKSGADDDAAPSTVPAQGSDDGSATDTDQAQRPDASKKGERAANRFRESLKGLVDNGTITQEQADAVIKALTDARTNFRSNRVSGSSGWMGGRGHAGGAASMFRGMKEIYEAIGLEPEQIFEQLRDGRTIAQIAEERGVTRQALIDAVIDPLKGRLDTAVADGKMTREKADELITRTTDGINKAIDSKMPSGWKDITRRGHHGDGESADGAAKPGD